MEILCRATSLIPGAAALNWGGLFPIERDSGRSMHAWMHASIRLLATFYPFAAGATCEVKDLGVTQASLYRCVAAQKATRR